MESSHLLLWRSFGAPGGREASAHTREEALVPLSAPGQASNSLPPRDVRRQRSLYQKRLLGSRGTRGGLEEEFKEGRGSSRATMLACSIDKRLWDRIEDGFQPVLLTAASMRSASKVRRQRDGTLWCSSSQNPRRPPSSESETRQTQQEHATGLDMFVCSDVCGEEVDVEGGEGASEE
eukprot:747795-Hanusia_phi.AAC.1